MHLLDIVDRKPSGIEVSRNGNFGFVLVDVESRNWGKWTGVEQS